MPEAQIVAGAVADIFGALAVAPGDTRLEPGRKNLLWLAVNIFHRAIGRTRRELDDRGAEEPPTRPAWPKNPLDGPERLTSEGMMLIERRDSTKFCRDQAAAPFERHTHAAWRPRAGSMVNHRTLTSAMIDSRDFIAAERRAEPELLVPAGSKIAVTCGLDFNDHRLIRDKLDRVHAKHPDMVLLHGGSPKGAELIAAKWADHRKVPQIAFKPHWDPARQGRTVRAQRSDAGSAADWGHGVSGPWHSGQSGRQGEEAWHSGMEVRDRRRVMPPAQAATTR